MFRAYAEGAWKAVRNLRISQGGNWRLAKRASTWKNGGWQVFFIAENPMALTFIPATLFVSGFNSTQTGNPSAIVSGGQAPLIYLWTVSGFDGPIAPTIINANLASPTIQQTGLGLGDQFDCQLNLLVTDSLGQTISGDLSASFIRQERN
jgi:hypothetical protein